MEAAIGVIRRGGANALVAGSTFAGGEVFDVPDVRWFAGTGGAMAGVGGVTKTGPGTLTVNGTHSDTGPTTVTGGTLVLAEGYLADGADVSLTTCDAYYQVEKQ